MNLGRLQKVELRDVWKSEAQDFTPWLAREENLKLLGDTIDLELALEAVEKDVGPFRADILCKETASDSWVLVENQVERTDHTHLGQIITYAAGLSAVTVVWIAKRFTDEHRAALDWLNEITGENVSFFGLEVELWRIGNSEIAPKFNVVSKPNEWTKGKGGTSTVINDAELTPARKLQLDYWTQFRAYALENSDLVRPQKAAPCQWMNFSIGTSKAHTYVYVNTQKKQIGIRLQVNSSDERLAIYNLLLENKSHIEEEIGCKLDWEEMPEKKSSYVSLRIRKNPNDKRDWAEQHQWLLEKTEAFKKTFGPRIINMDTGDWQPEDVEEL